MTETELYNKMEILHLNEQKIHIVELPLLWFLPKSMALKADSDKDHVLPPTGHEPPGV